MARRIPSTVFRGRVRTSTVALAVAFAAVLVLYVEVRPLPVATILVTNPDGSTSLHRSPSTTSPPSSSTQAPTPNVPATPG